MLSYKFFVLLLLLVSLNLFCAAEEVAAPNPNLEPNNANSNPSPDPSNSNLPLPTISNNIDNINSNNINSNSNEQGAPAVIVQQPNNPNPNVNLNLNPETHTSTSQQNHDPNTLSNNAPIANNANPPIIINPNNNNNNNNQPTPITSNLASHDGHNGHSHGGARGPIVNGGGVAGQVNLVPGGRLRAHGDHLHVVEDPNRLVPHGSHTHTVAEAERDSGFIMLVLLTVVIISQIILVMWKRLHVSSYNIMSLFGLWIIPFAWSLYGQFWRMLLIWLSYTLFSGWLYMAARKKPLDRTTPRRIYKWFFILYRVCYYLTVGGYSLIMLDIFGISLLVAPIFGPLSPYGIMCLFYGLYYGVLVRDTAHVVSNHLARSLGYSNKDGMPSRQLTNNTCAICDEDLIPRINGQLPDPRSPRDPSIEKVYKLNCGHQFHESCIKGWMLVGKRDLCAACSEKVNLKEVFAKKAENVDEDDDSFSHHQHGGRRVHGPVSNTAWPWEAQSMAWAVLLDGVRYLVVFNPIIIGVAQYILMIIY